MNPFRSFGKPSSSSFSLNAVWVTQHHQSTKKTASGGLSKQIQPIQHRADGSSRWCSSSYWCYAMYLRLLSSFLHLTLPPAHTFGEPLLRVLPYCRTAGLPYCRTVVLSYCRTVGPANNMVPSSVHRACIEKTKQGGALDTVARRWQGELGQAGGKLLSPSLVFPSAAAKCFIKETRYQGRTPFVVPAVALTSPNCAPSLRNLRSTV